MLASSVFAHQPIPAGDELWPAYGDLYSGVFEHYQPVGYLEKLLTEKLTTEFIRLSILFAYEGVYTGGGAIHFDGVNLVAIPECDQPQAFSDHERARAFARKAQGSIRQLDFQRKAPRHRDETSRRDHARWARRRVSLNVLSFPCFGECWRDQKGHQFPKKCVQAGRRPYNVSQKRIGFPAD
jgi:hypothetical protein